MNCDGTGQITSAEPPTTEVTAFMRRKIAGILLTLPAVAVLIVMLFLTMGRARISQTGTHLIASLIYTLLIGTPSAFTLTWMSIRWSRHLGRLIIVAQVLVLLCTALAGSLVAAFILKLIHLIPPNAYWFEFQHALPFTMLITLMVGLSLTAYQTLRYQLHAATLELRTRQMEQERANKLLAEARLSSLESRIHPHFLFNTLNSIAALIPSDPQRAEDTVGKLASLLRFSLNASPSGLVPLEQELKIVRDYLEIEATRFGKRLRYRIEVPESLHSTGTLPLALQSLVENAVKHVVAQRPEGASVLITGARNQDSVHLEVADDGPGFSLTAITPQHGLGNLAARLEILFGERGKLSMTRRDEQTVVAIEHPVEPQA